MFPQANTIVRVEEGKLLTESQYETLLNTDNLQSAIKELDDLDYFETYREITIDNHMEILDLLLEQTFRLLFEITEEETTAIYKLFALYYDIHNMKIAVKEKSLDTKLDDLYLNVGYYPKRNIRSVLVDKKYDILKNDTLTKGMFEALETKELYDVNFILDKVYFKALLELTDELDSVHITDFVKKKADLYNISAYYQMLVSKASKSFFYLAYSDVGYLKFENWQNLIEEKGNEMFLEMSDYSSIWESTKDGKSITTFDLTVDNYLMDIVKGAKLMAFGYEPICAYFYAKFQEIKNIRMLLVGKKNNYEIEEIKKRMRLRYEL